MGFRPLAFLFSVAFALSLAACGDNLKPPIVFDDAMTDAEPDAPPDALMCGAAPNLNCGGTCRDTGSDEANCGACGTACGTGQTCDTGVCCDAGKTNCGGVCVDLVTSNAHCGVCNEVCGVGETCTVPTTPGISTCCGGNQTACPGGQCFDTEISEQNCGGCGIACTVGQTCEQGHCCDAGEVWCGPDIGGACIDTTTDNNGNCGACAGTTGADDCVGAEVCKPDGTPGGGECCAATDNVCNGVCSNPDTDNANCGACNGTSGSDQCAAGTESCKLGICCGNALNNCGNDVCSDPQQDPMNCGGCAGTLGAEVCAPGETCLGGTDPSCCGPGQINCNGTCIDPQNDNANCGNCAGVGTGVACSGPTPVCSGGVCDDVCPLTEINCNNDCVDTNSDHNNCGGCGIQCGPLQLCNNGTCGATCSGVEVACAGQCVNTGTDPNHCGGCDPINNVCAPTDECVSGVCQYDCPDGQTQCGTGPAGCKDLMNDETACGSCSAAPCSGNCLSGMCCPSGQILCNGSCTNITNDPNNCGACGGVGAPIGTVCTGTDVCKPDGSGGGECCAPTDNVCGGVCSDPLSDNNNCGGCEPGPGQDCGSGTCDTGLCCGLGTEFVPDTGGVTTGRCCPIGNINCNDQCFDPQSSNIHCGTCPTSCTAQNLICVNGGCTASCDPPNENTCPGQCTNIDFAEDACGLQCDACATGATCEDAACSDALDQDADLRVNDGCPALGASETICNEAVGSAVDNDNDGYINDGCPANGPKEGDGDADCQACPTGPALGCNDQCTDTSIDNLNCGACGTVCDTGAGKSCTPTAGAPNGLCCLGNEITCSIGGTMKCVDPQSDEAACGGCVGSGGDACTGQETCNSGTCGCGFGQISCNGKCVTPSIDPLNCGGCATDLPGLPAGDICSASGPTEYCVSNGCTTTCPAPLTACAANADTGDPRKCTNTDSDNNNCGTCGNDCGPTQGCVDGTCRTKIVTNSFCVGGANAGLVCTNGTQCPGGTCTQGASPAKCAGGGPPIVVPIDGTPTCTGNLGATSFTFGMCSRTQIDVPAAIFTDAFNSRLGPHRPVVSNSACTVVAEVGAQCANNMNDDAPSDNVLNDGCPTFGLVAEEGAECTDALDNDGDGRFNDGCPEVAGTEPTECGVGGVCRGAGTVADPRVCIGGGVGVNGTVAPIAKTQQDMHVGGAFWAFGSTGLDWAKTTIVKQRLYNETAFAFASTGHRVYEAAFVNGPWNRSGNASMTIDGLLTTETGCPTIGSVPSAGLTLNGGCVNAPWDDLLPPPCGDNADTGKPGGWDIPVSQSSPTGGIVEHFRNPANNDNKLINLKYNALVNPSAPVRLELPCGNYYLDSIQGNQPLTIVVKGRTGLYIGGAADINVEMIFDVEPTASIDMFIGGVVNIAHPITLGSPAYPRLTRMYIGNSSVIGGGNCTNVSTCASGLCSACAAPSMVGTTPTFAGYAACTGTGVCQGTGSNLSSAINMSQGGFFNGLLWAGYGGFSSSNAVEMYGSIFANRIGASGDLTIHYDNGAVGNTDECPPPPPNQRCESCRDCGNQPCGTNNLCQTSCTADNECCPPLRCLANGTGPKTCKLF